MRSRETTGNDIQMTTAHTDRFATPMLRGSLGEGTEKAPAERQP